MLYKKHWSKTNYIIGKLLLKYWAFNRMVIFSILGMLSKRFVRSQNTWKEIWKMRAFWDGDAKLDT